jgi:hypothetical protein
MTDIPVASTPPAKHPRRPIETVNPSRRQGRLKPNPRKVSQANPLTGLYRRVETVLGKSDRSESYMGKVQEARSAKLECGKYK